MLQGLEALPTRALLLRGLDDAFHRAVLLRTMRRNEFLLQPADAHQSSIASAGEDQKMLRI